MLWNEQVLDTVSFEAWARTTTGGTASRSFETHKEARAWIAARRKYIAEYTIRPIKSQVRAYDSNVGAWARGPSRALGDEPDAA